MLPDLSMLNTLFHEFNRQYFDSSLPTPGISYSDRMLIAGSFAPDKNEIRIGRKYHEIFPDEIEDTLKHEMIHIIYPNHDQNFKALAARIGASLKAKSHPALCGNCKYLYICPHCGKEYPRRKRLRMAYCGICATGGQFHANYKLKLLKSLKKR
jgi:predicted SprT family Zn-dependent metalloprotease